jgi:single-stranded DNA-binding protein
MSVVQVSGTVRSKTDLGAMQPQGTRFFNLVVVEQQGKYSDAFRVSCYADVAVDAFAAVEVGDTIAVTGSLRTRRFPIKGEMHDRTFVVADSVTVVIRSMASQ